MEDQENPKPVSKKTTQEQIKDMRGFDFKKIQEEILVVKSEKDRDAINSVMDGMNMNKMSDKDKMKMQNSVSIPPHKRAAMRKEMKDNGINLDTRRKRGGNAEKIDQTKVLVFVTPKKRKEKPIGFTMIKFKDVEEIELTELEIGPWEDKGVILQTERGSVGVKKGIPEKIPGIQFGYPFILKGINCDITMQEYEEVLRLI